MKTEIINVLKKYNELSNGKFITIPLEEYVDKLFNNAKIITLFDKGRLQGFIAYYDNDIESKVGFLSLIFIDPDYQGKGVGKKLINMSIENLREIKFEKFNLEVKIDNSKAIKLYENFGFEIIEKRENSWIMQLCL